MKRMENVQYERFEYTFHNLKNEVQCHEILRLKFAVTKLGPSLNDFIGSVPEMYDALSYNLQTTENSRYWIDHVFA